MDRIPVRAVLTISSHIHREKFALERPTVPKYRYPAIFERLANSWSILKLDRVLCDFLGVGARKQSANALLNNHRLLQVLPMLAELSLP